MPKFTVSLQSSSDRWGNGKPLRSVVLPNGFVQHTLEDGRVLTLLADPRYQIDYLSSWIEAEPGETYEVRVALIGKSRVDGFVECWNYDIGEVRNYAYTKIVRLVDLVTGDVYSAAELQAAVDAA